MLSTKQLQQLKEIRRFFASENYAEAEKAFVNMKIIDTSEHLSLSIDKRNLIFNLYEFLVVRDHYNATDKECILDGFEKLFSEN